MYNDYYLQQIDNKLNTTNINLNQIIKNQNTIIQQNQQLISGDTAIIANQNQINDSITLTALILTTIMLIIFIIRGFK